MTVSPPTVPEDEYPARVERLRAALRQRSLEGALLDGPEAMNYLTGYTPTPTMYQALLIPLDGEPVIMVRANDRARASRQARLGEVVAYPDWDDPMIVLSSIIGERAPTRPLGKDMTSMVMTLERHSRLAHLSGRDDWVDVSDVIEEMRATKSEAELRLHTLAAEIADTATWTGIASMLGGETVDRAALAAHSRARELGADDRRTVVARPEPTRAEGGVPLAMLELVPAVQGYDARLIRTVALGSPSSEHLEAARRVLDIQDRQIAAMEPGAKAADVDAICREAMLEQGLRESYDGLTGHGLGFSWNGRTTDATYRFTPASEWLLRPGMIFHMYTRGSGFVVGDTILVTESGPQRLTNLERRIFSPEVI